MYFKIYPKSPWNHSRSSSYVHSWHAWINILSVGKLTNTMYIWSSYPHCVLLQNVCPELIELGTPDYIRYIEMWIFVVQWMVFSLQVPLLYPPIYAHRDDYNRNVHRSLYVRACVYVNQIFYRMTWCILDIVHAALLGWRASSDDVRYSCEIVHMSGQWNLYRIRDSDDFLEYDW